MPLAWSKDVLAYKIYLYIRQKTCYHMKQQKVLWRNSMQSFSFTVKSFFFFSFTFFFGKANLGFAAITTACA